MSAVEQDTLKGAGQPAAIHNPRRVSRARLFLRALGISFFSVLSVLVALYAFATLPQVQDVLLDARPYWVQEVLYWGNFYLIGIFVWALPLVFSARLLLLQNFNLIGIDTEERFKFYIFNFPRFFAIIAFVAVLLGMISASENVPMALSGNLNELVLRQFLQFHLIVLCLATACIILVILMRNVFIGYYSRRMEAMERGNPEAMKKSLMQIESLTEKHARKHEKREETGLHLMALKPEFLTEATWVAAQRAKVFMWVYMLALSAILTFLIAIHFLSYSDTLRGLFTMPDMSSYPRLEAAWHFTADSLSLNRAPLLLVLFGAWLPFLTILALLSNRHQFPFIVAFIAGGVILSLFVGEGHDVRIATLSKEQQAALKPVAFADALKDWKAASGWNAKGCEQLPPGAPELGGCPRPVIVAGEGGGSRAAFLLASVLGALEDESLNKWKNPTARPFHQQLFAISSVSGSSVGAAFFVSALKAQPNLSAGSLKKALYRQRLWFRNVAAAKPVGTILDSGSVTADFLTDFVSYKDALQAALSNDFLSPTMIAYLARDASLVSLFPRFMDRAGVLETAWEDTFDDVYGTSKETSPLSAPLQEFGPSPDQWTPLLFLNATSIGTGRRVVLTPVKIADPIGTGNRMLFADSYDFHELLCAPYPDPLMNSYPELSPLQKVTSAIPSLFTPVTKCVDRKPVSIDIRLSTAAGVSARSPFVSPHADVRNRRSQITDSVADGGYFDNSGIVTALDIAQGLKAVDARLFPFILQVSSEPGWFETSKNCALEGFYPASPQIPDEDNFRPAGSLADPLTVNATRVSRGYQTILGLPRQAAQLNGGLPSAAQIHICPQPDESFWAFVQNYTGKTGKPEEKMHRMMMSMEKQMQYKSISLSWWLSPPLQAYLDGQLYTENNLRERNCVISLLKDGQDAGAPACQRP